MTNRIGPEDLILCAGTVANTSMLERIPAATQAGFRAMSLFTSDVGDATAAGHTLSDLRARIAAVESAAPLIFGVQLDDAPEKTAEDLVEETLHARLLPGDGDANAAGVVRALTAGGCTAPLGVEVFSDELNRLTVGEVARRAYRAVNETIERSRQS